MKKVKVSDKNFKVNNGTSIKRLDTKQVINKEGNKEVRKTGIDIIGDMCWGMHLCVFYQTKEDLIDILVPYFKAGLENNEFCMWVTSEPISVEEAKNAMERVMPDFEQYFKKGQIEILPHIEWYLRGGVFNLERVLNACTDKLNQALAKGFAGLRLTGNAAWLEKKDWEDFTNYEEEINKVIGKYRMLAICTYSIDKCGAPEVINIISSHQTALIRQRGKWEFVETIASKKVAEELKESDEKFKIIFNGASDGILVADQETRKFLMGNKKICQMLGYSLEEIRNLAVTDIHPAEDLPEVLEQFEKQRKGMITLAKDLPTKRKDGSVFYADVNATPITLAGRPYIMGIFRDITERKKMEERLKEQKLTLEQKNLALKEMIEHIERTKNRMKEDIAINVDETLMPIVEKLKIKGVSPKYIKLLKHHLKSLSSSFGRKITQKSAKLTSREIEICTMIKGGLASKDISELLNVSSQTIEKHRKNIRKKLGLSNKKTNLFSYLQNI